MRRRTAWALVGAVAAVAVGAAAVGAVALVLAGGRTETWGQPDYLEVGPLGPLPERAASEFGGLFKQTSPSLLSLVRSLDRAAADPGISAALLPLGSLPDVGWARVQELRDAVLRFRKTGKPAYALLDSSGNKEYYLATSCDRIYALPTALIGVSGLSTEVTFYAGTLDKIGVEAQFVGIGKYKNAPNQYTEKGLTRPHREQLEALLDSFFGEFRRALAEGRGRDEKQVDAWLDAGPYDAQQALDAGLVDELLYRDELKQRMEGSRIRAARYAQKAPRGVFGLRRRARLALIYAVGEIVPGASQQGGLGGDYVGSHTLVAALRQAREDDSIAAIILRVDSPGGDGTAADEVWRAVGLAKKVKPVIASFGDAAASGGYYIAMAADFIVTQPGTITGSVGVFSGKFSLRGFYDRLGLSKAILSRGRHAALFSDYRPWDPEERAKVRDLAMRFYDGFVRKLAEDRGKSVAEVEALAQGRIWSGAEAVRNGLADRLGGLDVALEEAKRRAGIAEDRPVDLYVLPRHKGLLETLLDSQTQGTAGVGEFLPVEVRRLAGRGLTFGRGRLARQPFEIRVR